MWFRLSKMFVNTCGAVALVLLPVATHAQSLLALESDDGVGFWNTTVAPAEKRFSGLKGGTAGVCYLYKGKRLIPDPDTTACLSHLLLEGTPSTGGADPYDITGVVRARTGKVNEYSTGFMVSNVRGIEYCGERENCDDIYIVGVTSPAALTALANAVRTGATVRVQGPGAWNLESIDVIVDQISAAK